MQYINVINFIRKLINNIVNTNRKLIHDTLTICNTVNYIRKLSWYIMQCLSSSGWLAVLIRNGRKIAEMHEVLIRFGWFHVRKFSLEFATKWCMEFILIISLCNYMSFTKYVFTCSIISPHRKPHDDVIKWKHFPSYWPFMRGIHRSPMNSAHKGQWRGALMFSLICTRINGWINNGEAVDLRRHHAHYDVTVMTNWVSFLKKATTFPLLISDQCKDVTLCRNWSVVNVRL